MKLHVSKSLMLLTVLTLGLAAGLTGCGRIDYSITSESVEVADPNQNEYVNPDDSEDTYCYVEINGRKYLPYGAQNGSVTASEIGACIAYDSADDSIRYFEVLGTDDFIAEYCVGEAMGQISFLRAEDTMGETIEIPDCIDDLGYDIWK